MTYYYAATIQISDKTNIFNVTKDDIVEAITNLQQLTILSNIRDSSPQSIDNSTNLLTIRNNSCYIAAELNDNNQLTALFFEGKEIKRYERPIDLDLSNPNFIKIKETSTNTRNISTVFFDHFNHISTLIGNAFSATTTTSPNENQEQTLFHSPVSRNAQNFDSEGGFNL